MTDQLNRTSSAEINDWPAAFPALLLAEQSAGIHCGVRRIYSLIRFDEPLSLQPPTFTSTVFYAGRDPEANGRAGQIGKCDYIITSPAVADTEKGARLAEALAAGRRLRPFATTRDFVVLAIVPAG
jgi:hypothetical protein